MLYHHRRRNILQPGAAEHRLSPANVPPKQSLLLSKAQLQNKERSWASICFWHEHNKLCIKLRRGGWITCRMKLSGTKCKAVRALLPTARLWSPSKTNSISKSWLCSTQLSLLTCTDNSNFPFLQYSQWLLHLARDCCISDAVPIYPFSRVYGTEGIKLMAIKEIAPLLKASDSNTCVQNILPNVEHFKPPHPSVTSGDQFSTAKYIFKDCW